MKKFTTRHILKMPLNGRTPKPFPGKHPTRIFVLIEQAEREKLRYIGKPTQLIKQMIKQAWNEWNTTGILFVEFDRENRIREQYVNNPVINGERPVTSNNPILARYYYPYGRDGVTGEVFEAWLNNRMFPKTMLHRGKRRLVFSMKPTLRIKTDVEPYKAWLTKEGL